MKGFSGVLVSDAFNGYHAPENRRPEIRVTHCRAYARRDFADALKAFKKTGPSKQRVKKTVAFQALERIGTFHRLEDEWRDLAPQERLIRRQEPLQSLAAVYFACTVNNLRILPLSGGFGNRLRQHRKRRFFGAKVRAFFLSC